MLRTRRKASYPRRARSSGLSCPRARASGSSQASRRGAWSRSTTTRSCSSSSPTVPRAPRRSNGWRPCSSARSSRACGPPFRSSAAFSRVTRSVRGGCTRRWSNKERSMVEEIKAHITGVVFQITTKPGDRIAAGDAVIVLESMKMAIPVEAPRAGAIKELRVREGQTVQEGDVFAVLEQGGHQTHRQGADARQTRPGDRVQEHRGQAVQARALAAASARAEPRDPPPERDRHDDHADQRIAAGHGHQHLPSDEDGAAVAWEGHDSEVEQGAPCPTSRSVLDEGAEVAAAQRVAQLPQRLGLDLTDALARDREALADLLERVLALLADAEPEAQDLLLLGRKRGQRPLDLRRQVLVEERLVGRAGGLVLEKVAELGVLADRCLEGQRLPRRLENEPYLLRRHAGPLGQLLRRGLAAHLVDEAAVHP